MHHPHHITQGSFEEHSLHAHGSWQYNQVCKGPCFLARYKCDDQRPRAKCETCQSAQPKQQKETLLTTEIPVLPWDTVGADLFHFAGEDLLITTDYYTAITGSWIN